MENAKEIFLMAENLSKKENIKSVYFSLDLKKIKEIENRIENLKDTQINSDSNETNEDSYETL